MPEAQVSNDHVPMKCRGRDLILSPHIYGPVAYSDDDVNRDMEKSI